MLPLKSNAQKNVQHFQSDCEAPAHGCCETCTLGLSMCPVQVSIDIRCHWCSGRAADAFLENQVFEKAKLVEGQGDFRQRCNSDKISRRNSCLAPQHLPTRSMQGISYYKGNVGQSTCGILLRNITMSS